MTIANVELLSSVHQRASTITTLVPKWKT